MISKYHTQRLVILNLTVKSDYRNSGIGMSLVQLIINDARIRNSQDIILEVRSSNNAAQYLLKSYVSRKSELERIIMTLKW